MIDFNTEEQSAEWDQIFAAKLDHYAKCLQALTERIPNLDDWQTAMQMTNLLIEETDNSFVEKLLSKEEEN